MKLWKPLLCSLPLLAISQNGMSYPFDQAASDYTQIQRLEASRLGQEKKIPAGILPKGAFLGLAETDIRLQDRPEFQIPEVDKAFSHSLKQFLGDEAEDYGVAILDLSDPENPLYAEHQATKLFNPGSVGKLAVAIGFFQTLADVYPDDIEAREKLLRETMITADKFIIYDHHKVPIWNPETKKRRWRAIEIGDVTNLWGYLDWMLSASSNAAASMVLKQSMLLKHFGKAYPVSAEEEQRFFKETPIKERMALLETVLHEPITRNGLDLKGFRQGGFFTRHGKARVPGTSSHASPREMVKLLTKVEQGKIVDAFSSREIKRLLYITRKRIRYASHPSLRNSALYFKSGSYYKCVKEEGFKCGKYMGNKLNWMNSVIIVESPGNLKKKQPPTYYMVTVMSNVKKKNSAVAHQTLAMRIHRLIESYHSDKVAAMEAAAKAKAEAEAQAKAEAEAAAKAEAETQAKAEAEAAAKADAEAKAAEASATARTAAETGTAEAASEAAAQPEADTAAAELEAAKAQLKAAKAELEAAKAKVEAAQDTAEEGQSETGEAAPEAPATGDAQQQ